MELAERVEQLEQQVKVFRPGLHFPVTATLEHRVRWLEIVFGEMKARDNHGAHAETSLEEKLEKILGNTIYIRPDRITLHSLTADPISVVAGDLWFRSDVGKAKQAIDAVVANARLLRREGDSIPAAEIEDLDAAKITTGRFGLARMPDGSSGNVLRAKGPGVDPAYEPLTLADDVSGNTDSALSANYTGGYQCYQINLAQGAEFIVATDTRTFAAGSRAVAVGYTAVGDTVGTAITARLYMGGVLAAESAQYTNPNRNLTLVATRALSGSQSCVLKIYKVGAASNIWLPSCGPPGNAGKPLCGAVGVGSIKAI